MTLQDYVAQLLELFPQPWTSDQAKAVGSIFYGVVSSLAVVQQSCDTQLAYVKEQSRLLTATDTNLEAIAKDFLGPNFPRYTTLVNNLFVPESDPSYASRIQEAIIAPCNTIAAIQRVVQNYVNTGYQYEITVQAQVLGLDAVGGLDSWGALDGRSSTLPPIPSVYVFDLQSNPVLAAKVSLTAGQFAIFLTYGGIALTGFFLGTSHIGGYDTGTQTYHDNESFLAAPGVRSIPAPTSILASLVESVKAEGCQPLWFDNNTT